MNHFTSGHNVGSLRLIHYTTQPLPMITLRASTHSASVRESAWVEKWHGHRLKCSWPKSSGRLTWLTWKGKDLIWKKACFTTASLISPRSMSDLFLCRDQRQSKWTLLSVLSAARRVGFIVTCFDEYEKHLLYITLHASPFEALYSGRK